MYPKVYHDLVLSGIEESLALEAIKHSPRHSYVSIRLRKVTLTGKVVAALFDFLRPSAEICTSLSSSFSLSNSSRSFSCDATRVHWDTLEIHSCAHNEHLLSLLSFVGENSLFRKIILRAEPDEELQVPIPTVVIHSNLETLEISKMFVSTGQAVSLRKGIETSTRLRKLNLKSVKFERLAICQLAAAVEANRSIRRLNCRWFSSVDALIMLHSVGCHKTIKEINFHGHVPDKASSLVGKGLNLSDCPLESLSLTGLDSFDLGPLIEEVKTRSCHLKRLNLSDGALENYHIDYLFANLWRFPMLEELDLSGNNLSDFAQTILLDDTTISTSLKRLNLSYNRLSDPVVDELLTKLWKFPSLRSLDLSYNQIRRLKFPNFLANPNLYKLSELRMYHPQFCCLDPGEEYSLWLRLLLQKTPKHLKIGSFWGSKDVWTQHLLDTRQIFVRGAESSCPSIWPLAIARANELFEHEEERRASVIFSLVKASPLLTMKANDYLDPGVFDSFPGCVHDDEQGVCEEITVFKPSRYSTDEHDEGRERPEGTTQREKRSSKVQKIADLRLFRSVFRKITNGI